MPSSLIIVALAAAWLAVLVPMIVRKRQAVARTADTELAARVVRSAEDEFSTTEDDQEELAEPDESCAGEPSPTCREPLPERRYRPGRGGFDPEAAELAARAKYAFRQRVVLALIIVAVLTAVGAGFLFAKLWWVHGAVDLMLVGYLAYLRRQVRIEKEIRQRRLARYNSARARRAARRPLADYEEYAQPTAEADRPEPTVEERRTTPPTSIRKTAVVVDIDDEDPEFHELANPDQLPFRRAVGE